jgi:outer membrane protein OmpA-like peptidoglycan-associated protein
VPLVGVTRDVTGDVLGGLEIYPGGGVQLSVGGGLNLFSSAARHDDYRAFLGLGWTVPSGHGPVSSGLDADGDGVPDGQDQCPDAKEDHDGFQDDDGCPDPDNDRDGVADSRDRCPNEPEDRDGWQDDDGCPEMDNDGDGIPDAQDKCPERPEDFDGFEDQDGCPDIDNDLDGVLDIADKCPNVPETYNGFEDDDGCPDVLPGDVDALRGTIEGLLYGDGETLVRDSAQPSIKRIAKTMAAHPSIRVVLIGHTDDSEAKQFAEAGQPADPDALAADLSRARAEAVKNALVAAGVAASRVIVEGKGAEEPVADNTRPRGRLANRRVEIKLYVPPR